MAKQRPHENYHLYLRIGLKYEADYVETPKKLLGITYSLCSSSTECPVAVGFRQTYQNYLDDMIIISNVSTFTQD